MNVGDLEPDWIVDIAADTATNFTGVTSWRFDAWRETEDGKVLAFTNATPIVTPGASAWLVSVAHEWVLGQTAVAGLLHGVPVATWPGGREQSFPGASIQISEP